jgi:hypothetical protein
MHTLALQFDGSTFVPERDGSRLAEQTKAVFSVMKDGQFRTLSSLAQMTDAPEASVSARLRDLRKPRFGGHTVNRQYLGNGLFQYQLVVREASH